MAKSSLEEKILKVWEQEFSPRNNPHSMPEDLLKDMKALFREEMKALLPTEAVYDEKDNMDHKDGRIYGTKYFVIGYNDCLKEIKDRIEG